MQEDEEQDDEEGSEEELDEEEVKKYVDLMKESRYGFMLGLGALCRKVFCACYLIN